MINCCSEWWCLLSSRNKPPSNSEKLDSHRISSPRQGYRVISNVLSSALYRHIPSIDCITIIYLCIVVRNCSCQRNGNMYIQLAEDKCDKFAQYDNVTKLTYTHICPEGLKFSVEFCVCVHSSEVLCIGCGSPGRQFISG